MKPTIHLAAAAVFTLVTSIASAGNPVHFEARDFTFDSSPSGGWVHAPDTLTSNQAGAASISLADFAHRLNAGTYPSGINYNSGLGRSYVVTPRAGYRVTHFELSGLIYGERSVGQVPAGLSGQQGAAYSTVDVSASASPLDPWTQPYTRVNYRNANVEGYIPFVLTSAPLDLTQPFDIYVSGDVTSVVYYATWESPNGGLQSAPSTIEIAVMNSQLTIFTQPVPEPETYAMLLAGIGVIGALSRRRKSRAP